MTQNSSGDVFGTSSFGNVTCSARHQDSVRHSIGWQLIGFIFHLISPSYDYNTHVEGLLSANLCLVTLYSAEQRSQFERFRLQHVQTVNKTSSLKIVD